MFKPQKINLKDKNLVLKYLNLQFCCGCGTKDIKRNTKDIKRNTKDIKRNTKDIKRNTEDIKTNCYLSLFYNKTNLFE